MYTPKPFDVSEVVLPEQLQEDLELVAKNVHEIWAAGRMKEGWTYGESRNDAMKQTPCLVEYEALPEFEKDYDRHTALGTIKTLLKLGYRIEK